MAHVGSAGTSNNNLRVRALEAGDYDRGFLQLLAQLTVVGDVTRAQFEGRATALGLVTDERSARVREQKEARNHYFVVVVEDTTSGRIVAVGLIVSAWQLKFTDCNTAY